MHYAPVDPNKLGEKVNSNTAVLFGRKTHKNDNMKRVGF